MATRQSSVVISKTGIHPDKPWFVECKACEVSCDYKLESDAILARELHLKRPVHARNTNSKETL